MRARPIAIVLVLAHAACDGGAGVPVDAAPSPGQIRRERLALIRDTAAEMGVTNAALIGGIAVSETNLAHCWSEARYACMGPASPSCDGPIIAGSADGPCEAMQGGLGMFQFDDGTWAQTLATYGEAILGVAGNTAQAVSFVIDKVMLEVPGATGWLEAAAWINGVPLVAGDPVTEQWAQLMACEYNGCCAASALCARRAAGYRDHAIELTDELGAAFWRTADRCAGLPDEGLIAPRGACYLAAGDPRTWRREPGGFTGARESAATTAPGAPAGFARWILRARGRHRIEVYAARGTALATYRVVHGGATDTVTVDQAAATGFVVLGELDLAGTGDEHVELTTTGTPGGTLVFDVVRVTAVR